MITKNSNINKVYFKKAVAGITFENHNDQVLNNLVFDNCKYGIHFIDNDNYSFLDIENIKFCYNPNIMIILFDYFY